MEIQSTPASPPRKIRRIGSPSSFKKVLEIQKEQLGETDSNNHDNFNSNLEENTMQPPKSTEQRSAGIQAAADGRLKKSDDFFNNITDYASLRENGVSISENLAETVVDVGINTAETTNAEPTNTETTNTETTNTEPTNAETTNTETTNAGKSVINDSRLNFDCTPETLDQILKDLQCEDVSETKSMHMLLDEYSKNPASQKYLESFFRTNVHSYLLSSGELVHNITGCTELMNTLNKADSFTIIRLMAGVHNQCPIPMVMQGNEPTQNGNGSKAGTCEDAMYELHLKKVTGSLFTDMRAEMHDTSDKENISAIGKMLIKVFFTDQELLDGFVRKQIKKDGKEIQAYDPKRVFIMSQVINFMITETDDITVTKFKETTNKNKGLQGELYKSFVQSVMVDYANYLRKYIKQAKRGAV